MPLLRRATLLAGVLAVPAVAQYPVDLVGTWTTKSRAVLTGPGFYDPVNEQMFEPSLTGISYSFTNDGFYEEAFYRAVGNPTTPQCPQGIIQWQHGSYEQTTNGSLVLTPIAVDGRQLVSDPCTYKESAYTRYSQPELFKSYAQYTDPYHNVPRLDLYQFDGSPMNPMYLAFSPPQMLPTQTLNPTSSPRSTSAGATATAKLKRSLEDLGNAVVRKKKLSSADNLWWIGVSMAALGSIGFYYF